MDTNIKQPSYKSILREDVDSLGEFDYYEADSLIYDPDTKNWKSNLTTITNPGVVKSKSLSILCFNVWFSSHNLLNRKKAFLDLITNKNADIICLQEVTHDFKNFLQACELIQKNYIISATFEGPYDVLILSKMNANFFVKKFSTEMGRKIILAEAFLEDGTPLLIGNFHLESLEQMVTYRKSQLELINNIVKKPKNVVLAGDFNFDSTSSEQEVIVKCFSDFKDLWVIWEEKKGITDQKTLNEEGRTKNKEMESKSKAIRPDKILVKFNSEISKKWSIKEFEVVGRDEIEIDKLDKDKMKEYEKEIEDKEVAENMANVKTISNHYGLWTKIDFN